MSDDSELLRRYADDRDEAAFGELVRRHVNLVHSAALRQVNGDAHAAADVTQLVFTDLARKAGTLTGYHVLAGWLFTSTRFAAAKLVRGEQRRRAREQEAQLMHETNHSAADAALDWDRVRPVLDEALGELSATDREAILLRFFEGRNFAGVGAKLRLHENAARMRVDRALDRLHGLLTRRGVTSTTAALAVALSGQAVAAAPVGLATAVTGAALATAGGGGLAATLGFMSITKLQVGVASVLVAAGAGLVVQENSNARLRAELTGLTQQNQEIVQLRADNTRLARAAAEVALWPDNAGELARLRAEAETLAKRKATDLRARTGDELRTARTALAGMALRYKEGHPSLIAQRARIAVLEKNLGLAPMDDAIYDLNTLDVQPEPAARGRPKYPAELRTSGVPGEVLVNFIIGQNGEVLDAVAAKSTQKEFEAAALDAIKSWKFSPGIRSGLPVNVRTQISIVFNVNPEEVPTWF